jgi:hypothetical protein
MPYGWNDFIESPSDSYGHKLNLDTTNDKKLSPFSFVCFLPKNSISSLIPPDVAPLLPRRDTGPPGQGSLILELNDPLKP